MECRRWFRPDLSDPTPVRTRQLALAAGIAGNIAILAVYKYADFLAGNLNLALAPFGPHRLALLHLALPIGVSFVVFEKITYLVDSYRGTSRPAASFSDYCLFVLFFPKLLAGPILKYHEMKDQIAAPPAIDWNDFRTGFLRFARGLGRQAPDRRSARPAVSARWAQAVRRDRRNRRHSLHRHDRLGDFSLGNAGASTGLPGCVVWNVAGIRCR